MNIQARLKQAEERAMLLKKKADTIHLIMVKPVPGKERLYTILGEDGIYNEKKLAEFQQKHSVVTTIILNIPRLTELLNGNCSISGHLIRWRTLSVRNLLRCGLKPGRQESLPERQRRIRFRNLWSMQRGREAVMQKCFI